MTMYIFRAGFHGLQKVPKCLGWPRMGEFDLTILGLKRHDVHCLTTAIAPLNCSDNRIKNVLVKTDVVPVQF